MPSRIFCGITTWNFGEMVTVSMRHTVSRSIGVSRIAGIEDDAGRPVNWMFSHGGTKTRRGVKLCRWRWRKQTHYFACGLRGFIARFHAEAIDGENEDA
jgi:hypothetical protein